MKAVQLCALVTFLMLALMAHAVLAEKALRLKVSPSVSFAPAKLAVQIRLHPDPDDRWLTVGMDSGAYQRFSGFTIEGNLMFYSLDWRDVPQGDYEVQAAVGHGDVTRATDRVTVIVRGF